MREKFLRALYWALMFCLSMTPPAWVGYRWYSARRASIDTHNFLVNEMQNNPASEFLLMGGEEDRFKDLKMGIADYERPNIFGGSTTIRLVVTMSKGEIISSLAARSPDD